MIDNVSSVTKYTYNDNGDVKKVEIITDVNTDDYETIFMRGSQIKWCKRCCSTLSLKGGFYQKKPLPSRGKKYC